MEFLSFERFAKRPVWVVALALVPLIGGLGCASAELGVRRLVGEFFNRSAPNDSLPAIVEPRIFLGGEALAQKKARMRRVHADLVHLFRGYELSTRQHKRKDQAQLEGLIRPFIERQVDPLFASKGEGWNTDLRLLEANLLFAKAALFVAIEEERGLADVVAVLSHRFANHESLLIEYPLGDTQTLAHGIRDLRRAQASL